MVQSHLHSHSLGLILSKVDWQVDFHSSCSPLGNIRCFHCPKPTDWGSLEWEGKEG